MMRCWNVVVSDALISAPDIGREYIFFGEGVATKCDHHHHHRHRGGSQAISPTMIQIYVLRCKTPHGIPIQSPIPNQKGPVECAVSIMSVSNCEEHLRRFLAKVASGGNDGSSGSTVKIHWFSWLSRPFLFAAIRWFVVIHAVPHLGFFICICICICIANKNHILLYYNEQNNITNIRLFAYNSNLVTL